MVDKSSPTIKSIDKEASLDCPQLGATQDKAVGLLKR